MGGGFGGIFRLSPKQSIPPDAAQGVNRRGNGDRDRHVKGDHPPDIHQNDVLVGTGTGTGSDGAQLRFLNRKLSLPVSTMRSEARRVGKECGSKCSSGWSRYN